MTIRLFIADDHPVVVEGIERFVLGVPDVTIVGTAAHAHDLEERVAESRPDVLSLDVQMPGMRGPSTVAAAAALGIPILLFTLHPIDDAIAALVHAGAKGYLGKSTLMPAYVEAVRTLYGGGTVLPEALTDRLAGPSPVPPEELLSPRELEVFERLAQGDSIKEAAFHLGVAQSTLYTHAARVREKLGVSSSAELVRYADSWKLDTDTRD